ncbi:MAG: TetR/AcrR family transcriptional regulator, partial [Rhodobacteraceae bacterium]|nr:TetR/AcrR family transcriptional regulator [Paracoccaceae bacterium]
YYPGKEALLFDILDSHLRELRDRIVGQEFASNDPEQQLRATVAELLVAYEGADAEHAVQLNAIHALPEAMQEVLRGYQRDLVRFVAARLRDIASPALAADRTRLRAITMSVFAMTNWHYQWDAGADQAERHAYADLICDLITGGLHGLG